MPGVSNAVFLSYASEDAPAAQRIADALRAAGIEVWFDREELRGGDAWDQKIRHQIRDCRLFVPIISAHSEARLEGYFRREWKLAVDRTDDMASEVAFLVPVVIDETPNASAHVPERFRHVQWTRLKGGEPTSDFLGIIAKLLSPATVSQTMTAARIGASVQTVVPAFKSGMSRRAVAIAGIVAIAIAAVGYLELILLWHRGAHTTTSAPDAAPIAEKSIAVLPFADLSEKHDQEYFADGLADSVIDLLAHIPDIKVISRTSSFQFKGKNEDVRAVGRALGVNYLVEGSVRRSAERVRVTAQLINAADGSHIWSETFDQTAGDVLKLQDEIASNLARALQLSVGGGEYPGRTAFSNVQAYDLYLRGLHSYDRSDKDGVQSAVVYFRQAADLDPHSNRIADALANSLVWSALQGYVDRKDGFEQARRAVQHVLSLNSRSSAGYANLALIELNYDWDWAATERDLTLALQLNPRDATALAIRGDLHAALGQWDDGARMYEQAMVYDPLEPAYHANLGWLRYATGRLAAAEAEWRRVLQISPLYDSAHTYLGQILLAQQRSQDALLEMQQEQGSTRNFGLAIVYHALSRHSESDAALARLISDHAEDNAFGIAEVYGYRGQFDDAYKWITRAHQQRDVSLPFIKALQGDPLMNGLTRDSRYAEILRKMKLPE
jgi:TolB-like protein/Tfp pilus assembly protein PilF